MTWPMVNMHNRHTIFQKVPEPGLAGGIVPVAPLNQLSMLTDYINPMERIVACPNQDVVYGFGIISLDREPVIVQVPDFGDRFWVYQACDQRTDGFFMNDTADDRKKIQPLISQIMAYPLSQFTGEMKTKDWSKIPEFPSIGGGEEEVPWVVPGAFHEVLPQVLDEVPPLPGEESRPPSRQTKSLSGHFFGIIGYNQHKCFFKVEVLIKLTHLLVYSLRYLIVPAEEKREKGNDIRMGLKLTHFTSSYRKCVNF